MSSPSANITSILKETRKFPPAQAFSDQAHVKSVAEYEKLWQKAKDDPEGFWGEQADSLHWFQPWTKVLEWKEPHSKWFVGGKLNVYDNPLGVVTNSPTFDWHMTNLRNYVNLSADNVPPLNLGGMTLAQFGQGSGLRGLPGDFTPPSRFVRAVAFSQSAVASNTASEAVLQAFHILNNFDIPYGAVRDTEGGQMHAEYTTWTSASDLKNLRYYFRTYENSRIRMIDLRAVDLDVKQIRTISMKGQEEIEDVSAKAK